MTVNPTISVRSDNPNHYTVDNDGDLILAGRVTWCHSQSSTTPISVLNGPDPLLPDTLGRETAGHLKQNVNLAVLCFDTDKYMSLGTVSHVGETKSVRTSSNPRTEPIEPIERVRRVHFDGSGVELNRLLGSVCGSAFEGPKPDRAEPCQH
jgi:hypothetical protein